jgi:triacylglycerol lipase
MHLPPGFDNTLALEAADLVNQAYDQFEHFLQGASWSLQGNYDTLGLLAAKPEGLLARKEPFGFVARNGATGTIFVTFRGTKSLEDWLSDLTFPQVAHPWGAAEQGFSFIYDQCSGDALAAVKNAPAKNPAAMATAAAPGVVVTGHSLGAGLAILSTADLVNSGVAPAAQMYSFAGPRVGDLPFAAKFNSQVGVAWRIVNTEDVVTTVPLATPDLFASETPHTPLGMVLMLAKKLNYEHIGTPVSFTTHNGSIANNHAMQTYINALKLS